MIQRPGKLEQRFLHVPGRRGTALGAQAAMNTKVFILDHDPRCLFQRTRYKQGLIGILPGRPELAEQIIPLGVGGNRQALRGTDVQASVAFDAKIIGKNRLDITVKAALDLFLHLVRGKAQLDFRGEVFESLR